MRLDNNDPGLVSVALSVTNLKTLLRLAEDANPDDAYIYKGTGTALLVVRAEQDDAHYPEGVKPGPAASILEESQSDSDIDLDLEQERADAKADREAAAFELAKVIPYA